MTPLKPDNKKGYNTTTILFIVIIFSLSLLLGYMYFKLQEYDIVKKEYTLLYNRTTLLEGYYGNLTNMYSEIRSEYTQLLNVHRDLLHRYSNLTKEYNDVMNYNKEVLLVSSQTAVIPIKSNVSYTYELSFSGYIIMNYTANDDIYVWIGSSVMEGVYYSRYPQFPETAEAASFLVPVAPTLYVYLGNPNEFNDVRVEFTIKFVY